jgi:foldase protein PrsA
MVENMVNEGILIKKAKELKVTPDEKTLQDLTNKKIEEIKTTVKEEDVKKAGFTQGFSDPKLIAEVKNSVLIDKLIEEVTKNEKVEDKEAQDYYAANPNYFTTEPNKVHVAHILVKTEDEAKKVKERLDKGEAFDKVAKEVSIEPAAKESGGDLPEIAYTDTNYDATFMAAAIALKEGTLSNPVKTQFGWHIIKSIKKSEFPVKKFDEVKAQLLNSMLEQKKSTKFQEELAKWQEEAKIKYFEENY